jgi:RNA polymerase sigma-70 factor, ECF subfamily
MDMPVLCCTSVNIKNSGDVGDDLIARAQAGDNEAFGLIIEHHYRFVYKFIYALVGEPAIAEELTQETFLSAYKGIHLLRGDAKLRTWLFTIGKNTVNRFFRSHRKEGKKAESEVETLNLLDEKNPRPDRQFLSKELKALIYSALEKLDDDKRLVFILKEFQQLSYKEISEITGHAIPKLKTDLRRAKTEMRTLLRPYTELKNEV